MSTSVTPAVATTHPFEPLPVPQTVTGQRTRAVMRRAALMLAALWIAAGALVIADISDWVTAFALGVLIPGGGFLFTGQWVLFALSLVAFAVALLIFFVMSPYWVPPLVLFGLAALAALFARRGGNVEAASKQLSPATGLARRSCRWIWTRASASPPRRGCNAMACCALAAYLFGSVLRGLRRMRGGGEDTQEFAPAASRPGPVVTQG